ncbi:endonuclease domain-containing protein [Agromyces soli]
MNVVRRGWYAADDAPSEIVRAVRVGGALTAASVVRLHGLWSSTDPMLHVRVPRNASRLRGPDAVPPGGRVVRLDARRDGVCVHYRSDPPIARARDPLPVAFSTMLQCAERGAAVAALDAALAAGALSPGELAWIEAQSSPAARSVLRAASGGSESGIETRVRLLLRSRNIPHRTQARIAGVGRVDLLVGDRLVIEVDGAAYHSGAFEFENDRRRDFELMMRGFLVLRVSYRMVVEDWEVTRRGILELIARGEHRWGTRARQQQPLDRAMPGIDRIDDAPPAFRRD